jgi:hypothetical protein
VSNTSKFFVYFRNNSGSTHFTAVENTSACIFDLYIVYSFLLGNFHCGFIQFSNILNARTWYHACWSPFRYGKSGIYAAFQLECILYQSLTSQNRISFQSYNVGTVLIGLNSTHLITMTDNPTFQETISNDARRNGSNNWLEKLQVSRYLEIFSYKFYQII